MNMVLNILAYRYKFGGELVLSVLEYKPRWMIAPLDRTYDVLDIFKRAEALYRIKDSEEFRNAVTVVERTHNILKGAELEEVRHIGKVNEKLLVAEEEKALYEVYKENKLTGDEVRNLVFGRTEMAPIFAGGTWTIKFEKDGNALYDGYGFKVKGKWWVEGNQLCQKCKKISGAGLTSYHDLYRNPSGTLEGKDQYLRVTDFGMLPVSHVD